MSGDKIFFTLTLRPNSKAITTAHGTNHKAVKQWKNSMKDLKSIVNLLYIQMVVIPELTKNGIIHYHGIIAEKESFQLDIMRDLLGVSKTFGRYDFQIPKHLDETITYLFKDYNKTFHIINRLNRVHQEDIIYIHNGNPIQFKNKIKYNNLRDWLDAGTEDGPLEPSPIPVSSVPMSL